MRNQLEPKLAKWPFFLGDAFLFGASWFIYFQSKYPMGPWQIFFVVSCVAGGAVLAILPFLLEFRLAAKLAESSALASVVSQVQNLEALTAQVSAAANRWELVQEGADKTATVAGE